MRPAARRSRGCVRGDEVGRVGGEALRTVRSQQSTDPPRSWTRLSGGVWVCQLPRDVRNMAPPTEPPQGGSPHRSDEAGAGSTPVPHRSDRPQHRAMYTVVFVMTNNSKRTTTTPLDGMPRIGLHAGQYWIMWRSGGCLHHCLQAVTLYLPYGVDIIYMYNI